MMLNLKPEKLSLYIRQECPLWKELSFDLKKETRHVAQEVLKRINPGLFAGELTVVLGNDAQIRHLNKTYCHKDKPTNILSFGYGKKALEMGLLGDLFVAFETVQREAEAQKKTFHDHYIHLIIHGILHLLGYDHEEEAEAEIMEQQEIELLQLFNISNPYQEK